MEVLALIPTAAALRASPARTLLLLAGRPLIAYTIEQALAARRITRTIVSTEDEEIAETAKRYGAVPFRRPAEFAGDLSPDIDVFRHALGWLAENEGYQPELVVHLRPTGPIGAGTSSDRPGHRPASQPSGGGRVRSVSWPVQNAYKMWRIVDNYSEPLLQIDGLPDTHSMPRQISRKCTGRMAMWTCCVPRTVLEMGSSVGRPCCRW